MEADLKALESKLVQLIAVCQRLKSENHNLRQELALSQSDARSLKETMSQAEGRLQAIIEQLPEGLL